MAVGRTRASLVRAAVVAALAASAATPAPAARDSLSAAMDRRIETLRSTLRADARLYASAVRTTLADLRAGRATPDEAVTTHASALAFLSAKADGACDVAAAGFLADASAAMLSSDDASLAGAAAGGAGSIDVFVATVRAELAKSRAAASSKSRSFARTFTRSEGGLAGVTIVLPDWTFDLPGAPTPAGVVADGGEPLRLRVASAARLPDGRLVVAACGTAAADRDGTFDIRLRGASVDFVSAPLSDGGVAVAGGGTWSVTTEIGDPFHGDVPVAGNRVLQFGTEPFDAGLAGRQPGRLVIAAVLALP